MKALSNIARNSAVEVKKYALRQSKDGLVVSLLIHPNDMPESLLTDAIGQRYMIAFVAVDDEDKPIAPTHDRSAVGKEQYAISSPEEQARTRSILLAKDTEFWEWAGISDEAEASAFIRKRCRIHTRAAIATDSRAFQEFRKLESEYRRYAGHEDTP